MIKRLTKSISVAVRVAAVGFEKSFIYNEEPESILGYRDYLTKIPNRKAFERDKKRFKRGYALVMIDIDQFKKINDSLGHNFGDLVLKRLAGILTHAVGSDGIAYRIGGDEFVMIVPNSRVRELCEQIRRNVRCEDRYTISQGVLLDMGSVFSGEAITYADKALFESKHKGRGMITTAAPAAA